MIITSPTFIELFASVSVHTTTTRRITESTYRLDAPFFSRGAESARLSLDSSGFPTVALGEIARVFALSDFSLLRIPAERDRGIPFYTCSDIMEWMPHPTMFLSRKHETNLMNYIVEDGWILVSRSGTIGNTHVVAEELTGKAVANHAIRITPLKDHFTGLLYIILSGEIGQLILKSLSYGSVVGEIKPAQIEQMQIPMPPMALLKRLNRYVQAARSIRTEAITLHRASAEKTLTACGLEALQEEGFVTITEEMNPQAFTIPARWFHNDRSTAGEYRLDAHFYNPTVQQAVANIKACRSAVRTVGEVAERVLMGPRFKRNYVESTHGVPFLSGKNIVQIRPTDLKYLSNLQMADMQELLVKRGWTLITCSGTIGRTCFVWENYENYAASQHILRVIPDESQIDPGYLYAFLSSRYGYEQILRYRHGSVIDEVTDKQIEHVLVPSPPRKDQEAIGDMVRGAYDKRAEALRLEDEAQTILKNELTKAQATKGE
jgi:type I restriction enzyme S subunit